MQCEDCNTSLLTYNTSFLLAIPLRVAIYTFTLKCENALTGGGMICLGSVIL